MLNNITKINMESKSKEEAGRIVEMFKSSCWECGGFDTALSFAIIHVEGIIKENKSILNLIKTHTISSLRIAHPIEWRLEELHEVLTILKEKYGE